MKKDILKLVTATCLLAGCNSTIPTKEISVNSSIPETLAPNPNPVPTFFDYQQSIANTPVLPVGGASLFAKGDFDGDGDMDMLITNSPSDYVEAIWGDNRISETKRYAEFNRRLDTNDAWLDSVQFLEVDPRFPNTKMIPMKNADLVNPENFLARP